MPQTSSSVPLDHLGADSPLEVVGLLAVGVVLPGHFADFLDDELDHDDVARRQDDRGKAWDLSLDLDRNLNGLVGNHNLGVPSGWRVMATFAHMALDL